jgi:hypothetical protein
MDEVWKDIKGYEGLYQISNIGRVKSFKYNHIIGKILKPKNDRKGYLFVSLWINGKEKHCRVHRLVAEAFIPNPNNLPEVNHKSEKKFENYVWINEDGTIDLDKSNLEWCDRLYNINYGTGVERRQKPVKQMTLDGQVVAIWPSASEAGKNGFTATSIWSCCNRKIKTHNGFKWQYA